ncbi:MAG: DUF2004 domain-containing protein [Ferruginibacter sp.]
MAAYLLPPFGQIYLTNLEAYYDATINYDGKGIELDLNFENKTSDSKQMDAVKGFIDRIAEFDKKNRKYIDKDYTDDEGDTVKLYVQHHLEDIGKVELSKLVDFDNNAISSEQQLVKALHLVRVGLYPDSEDQFAIFDYSIGRDLTDYLVVINTDKNGKLDYMTMES